MAPIQKEVYKGILLRDKTLLNSLGQNADGGKGAMKSLNNMLMQLRKSASPHLLRLKKLTIGFQMYATSLPH